MLSYSRNILSQIQNSILSLYVDSISTFFLFSVHILYAILSFSTGALFSRYLGVTAFGIYDYAEGVSEVLLALCLFGFDRQLISRVASLKENKQWQLLKGLIIFSRKVTIIASIIAGFVIVYLTANDLILFKLEDKEIQKYFKYTMYVTALIIPVRVYLRNDQAIMHGMQRVTKGHLPDFIVRPIILICGALFLHNLSSTYLTAPNIMLINLFAAIFSFFLSTILIKKELPIEISGCFPSFSEKRKWILGSIPLLLFTGATIMSLRLGTIILGWIANFEQVAQYGIVMRVALIVNLIPLAINKVLAPKLSIAYHVNDKEKLNQIVLSSIMVCFMFSFVIGCIIIFFEKNILYLFGDSYTDRNMILALRFFIMSNVMLSPFSVLAWLLMMTNHNWQASLSVVAPVIVSPIIFISMVPLLDILGAILAFIFTSLLRFILNVYFVRKLKLLSS